MGAVGLRRRLDDQIGFGIASAKSQLGMEPEAMHSERLPLGDEFEQNGAINRLLKMPYGKVDFGQFSPLG